MALGAVVGGAVEGPTLCPFLTVTGLPCPFCGLTRALMALGDGDVGASMAFSPLGMLAAPLALVLSWRLAGAARAGRALAWPAPVMGAAVVLVAVSWASQLSEGVV